MTYQILGITSAVLLFFQISLFVFRRIYKYLPKKPTWFPLILKFLRRAHVYTGIALLIVGFIHGYLALGTIRLHTGLILWLGILLAFVGFLFKNKVGKKWIFYHRIMGFVLIALFFVHYFFPWLLK
ncbi:hypothetical protein SAMN04488510_11754 [Fervidobacterium changbaicum]|uniref:Uncharacterized protein n=1 Tax=Fervidobacterium changbaicum TaxID=310769 RepID=A0ABX5QQE7_9BACT|nr:hypothetical protein [Fervidobacterium changbaicum]QAV32547.1 hypothetical protein CBS1_01490 [Fervidobacterium changbaicum]SDH52022.1 hypothetical protein SAMN04488510_11754 [Fervidobacterium changbaicum]